MTTHREIRDGMQIDWDVDIEVDDGLVLKADVFRPVEEGQYPVLLTYGPYGKGLPFQDGYSGAWEKMAADHPDVTAGSTNAYQNWEVADPEKWVPHGYVCVRVDSRGCGRSPGFIDHFSARETRDLYECVEWAGVQPWSTGKVAVSGISYYAINAWHVAGMQPPHLTAMIPWEGAADFYRDMSHHGGIVCTFFEHWYDMQVKTVQHGRGPDGGISPFNGLPICGDETLSEEELERNRADFGATILAHPLDDEFHRERSADWSRITVPFLSAANWGGQGLHLRGNVDAFTNAASEQKWLEIHGIEHWTEYYTAYGVDLQKRFLDHFLKGEDNGWDQTPPVLLRVRHLDHFEDRAEHEWPIARTQWTRWYLDAGEQSLTDAAPATSDARAFEALGDGVTFWSPPMPTDTEITGPMAARLYVSSSTSDADLFLVVRVFSPDDEEVVFQGAIDPHTPIAQGWLRASHRKLDAERSTEYQPYHTHDERWPLEPGEIVELDVEIWPTSLVVPAGYRVALSVLGRDYEYPLASDERLPHFKNVLRGCGPFLHDDPTDRPASIFGGTTTVYAGGEHPSHLLVPIVPPNR